MLRALLYLRLMSARNWVRSQLRRLQQPKYLAGVVVGVAYFYLFFFRNFGARSPALSRGMDLEMTQGATEILSVEWLPVATAIGSLGLFVVLALMWLVPRAPAALGFSEAEIAFLFPAPYARRSLVHFQLVSTQFRSLLGATLMMLLSQRWMFLGGNVVTHAVGWWFIFSAVNLHFSGAGFSLTRLAESGVGSWRRRIWVAAGLTFVVGIALARLPEAERLPAMGGEFMLRPLAAWAVALTQIAPLSWALWPLQLVLGPFLAVDAAMFLKALAPALAVITLHYLWVVNTAVAFEDATIDRAQKRSGRTASWRRGERAFGGGPSRGRAVPFRLTATGRPEIAFLWKNLLSAWPYFNLRVFGGCAVGIAILCVWMAAQPAWRGVLTAIGAFASIFALYVVVIGPQFARQDLRSDLQNTDILKIYPLAGWQVVLGQLLAPAAILTGVLWLALLTAALAFHPSAPRMNWLTPGLRVAITAGVAAGTPVLVMLQLLVPNAAALIFPAWFQSSRARGGGVDVVGQRMIFFFAQLLTMIVALIPAAALGTAVVLVGNLLAGPIVAAALATLAAIAVLGGEVALGVWLLGGRFEKLDLSSELRP